jgi:PAS domain S-box-containing protein
MKQETNKKEKDIVSPDIVIVNTYTLIAVIYCATFSLLFYFEVRNIYLCVIHLVSLAAILINYTVLKRSGNFARASNIILTIGSFVVTSLFATGGWDHTGFLWPFAYLPFAFFLTKGNNARFWVVGLYIIFVLILFLHLLEIITLPYSGAALFNFFAALAIFAILMLLHQNAAINYETFLQKDQELKVKTAYINENAKRLAAILEVLVRTTQLDFSKKIMVSEKGDAIDSLASGLNRMSETLETHIKLLNENNERFRTIVRNAPEAVVIIDQDSIIREWNPRAESIFNWKFEEVAGKPLHEIIIPPHLREAHLRGINHYLKTGEGPVLHKPIEMPALRKDGTEFPAGISISPFNHKGKKLFVGFISDITERKETEKQIKQLNAALGQRVVERTDELHKSEEKYRYIFENNPMPMWVISLADFHFMDVNEAAIYHYGYSREEFLSMTALDIRPDDERDRFFHIDRNNQFTTTPSVWRHIKKDGTVIYVEVSAHAIDIDGKKARIVLSNDVTERRKMEDEINNLNRDLEERVARRTEELQLANDELDAFTYSVSHDLRAPLRAINGYAQILMEDYSEKIDAEGVRTLDVIVNNAKRMAQLIDDLLDFSRLGKLNVVKVSVDMNALATSIADELKNQQSKKEVEITIKPLPAVYGDSSMLKQVMTNLISNALKYSAKKETSVIEIGSYKENSNIVYYVKDNGSGFDMQYYEKLFGVFQRLHSMKEFEGTGVGLALVKRIITKHGGSVWAEGKIDNGATFYISLPEK